MTSRLFPEITLIDRLANGSRQIQGGGQSTAIVAKTYGNLTSNARLNQSETAWERIDTGQAAFMVEVGPYNRVLFFYAAAGANPIVWTEVARLNSAGGFMQLGGESLRTLRGQVSAAGAVVLGSGFTSSRSSAGIFAVNFTTAFSAQPVVVPSLFGATGNFNVAGANAASCQVNTYDTAWAAADRAFNFIAIGPA